MTPNGKDQATGEPQSPGADPYRSPKCLSTMQNTSVSSAVGPENNVGSDANNTLNCERSTAGEPCDPWTRVASNGMLLVAGSKNSSTGS